MTDINTFDDFTIAETQMWGRNIGVPFSDYQQVFRSVVTQLAFELAQTTDVVWYARFMEGEPEDWVPPEIEKDSVKVELSWRDCMARELAMDVSAANLVDWCEDVLASYECYSAIDLRRYVTDELQRELVSCGDWDSWLCHLAYVLRVRDDISKGVAVVSWRDYCKDTPLELSKAVGLAGFLAWGNSRAPLDDDEDEGDEGDNPLETMETESTVPAAAV